MNEYEAFFDSVPARISTGLYHDSEEAPDLFIGDEYTYTGEKPDFGDFVTVKTGDTFCGNTVKEVSLRLWVGNDGTNTSFSPSWERIVFEDGVKLTGVLRYYNDEWYGVYSGDIIFIPDSSYKGMPTAISLESEGTDYFFYALDFDSDDDGSALGDPCVMSDSMRIRLGNLYSDYSDRSDIYDIEEGGGANLTKRVEVTLDGLTLEWNDQLSFNATIAVLRECRETDD